MAHKQIYYSDKYDDDKYEYRSVRLPFWSGRIPSCHVSAAWSLYSPSLVTNRHVMLPKEIAKRVPKTHLMSETEWRNLGVQQSQGWVHYMIHQPGVVWGNVGVFRLFHWPWCSAGVWVFAYLCVTINRWKSYQLFLSLLLTLHPWETVFWVLKPESTKSRTSLSWHESQCSKVRFISRLKICIFVLVYVLC